MPSGCHFPSETHKQNIGLGLKRYYDRISGISHEQRQENRKTISKQRMKKYALGGYFKERGKRYRAEHSEKIKEYQKCYYKNYREENRDKLREYMKNYREQPANLLKRKDWEQSLFGKSSIKMRGVLRKFRTNDLSIQTIQLVYEDNIKKYGTLTCYLCLFKIEFGKDELEHKMPLSRGGGNEYVNLGVACKSCNRRKHTKTEEEYRKGITNA